MLFNCNSRFLRQISNYCFCAISACQLSICAIFFTRFPTMLATLTIADQFTIINYQAREYSRDATTGQWTLDGGRCLFFLEDTSYFLCIFDG